LRANAKKPPTPERDVGGFALGALWGGALRATPQFHYGNLSLEK
jgi:hypothetical protein